MALSANVQPTTAARVPPGLRVRPKLAGGAPVIEPWRTRGMGAY